MPRIELHADLRQHLKLLRLSRSLGVTKAQGIGHLSFLWLWASQFAPDGDLSSFTEAEISHGADYPATDALRFVRALKASKFLDADGKLHDWQDYSGKYEAQRLRSQVLNQSSGDWASWLRWTWNSQNAAAR